MINTDYYLNTKQVLTILRHIFSNDLMKIEHVYR